MPFDEVEEETPVAPTETAAATPKVSSTPTTKQIRREVEVCKDERKDRIEDWTESVGFHCGQPFTSVSETDRLPINKDWPRVKARVSSLFGQMPEARLLPKHPRFASVTPIFAKELNDTLKRADTFEAVFQCLTDHSATAGFGVVMVSMQRLTDMVPTPMMDVSVLDPQIAMQLMQSGQVPMEDIETTTDILFSATRLSPSDLLWPTNFTGFNFDKADWIGRSGEMNWAEAQPAFNLSDEDKEKVLMDGKDEEETLKNAETRTRETKKVAKKVQFDEIFYWAYRFDSKEKYFKKIRRIVFVTGMTDPVIHEDWVGQEFNEQAGTYVGACRFPIRVLKINYVSDDPIPPSESVIGRPQVLELIDYHTDQHQQRKRNKPIRGINTNKVDPDTLIQLMQGTWQDWIPINGRIDDAIAEVGRANYPPENVMFEREVNHHLDEVWQSGANQSGAFATGERSASEARIVQQNFDMRNGLDRAHVASFVQSICEVMAGLLALFGEFELATPEELQEMDQAWDRKTIAGEFVYEIIPDSMVRLDAHQQIGMLMDVLNMVGKSGFVNPAPFIAKICSLAGMDEKGTLTQPNPPPPPPLNISIRSSEDLHDPIMLALLMSTGQAPTKEHLEAAKMMITAMVTPLGEVPLDPAQVPNTAPPAPEGSATSPEGITVAEKIVKRSDYGS